MRNVSDAEIVQEEKCHEVGEWGSCGVSVVQIVQEEECRELGQWGEAKECQ